jgi:hypothetical protein
VETVEIPAAAAAKVAAAVQAVPAGEDIELKELEKVNQAAAAQVDDSDKVLAELKNAVGDFGSGKDDDDIKIDETLAEASVPSKKAAKKASKKKATAKVKAKAKQAAAKKKIAFKLAAAKKLAVAKAAEKKLKLGRKAKAKKKKALKKLAKKVRLHNTGIKRFKSAMRRNHERFKDKVYRAKGKILKAQTHSIKKMERSQGGKVADRLARKARANPQQQEMKEFKYWELKRKVKLRKAMDSARVQETADKKRAKSKADDAHDKYVNAMKKLAEQKKQSQKVKTKSATSHGIVFPAGKHPTTGLPGAKHPAVPTPATKKVASAPTPAKKQAGGGASASAKAALQAKLKAQFQMMMASLKKPTTAVVPAAPTPAAGNQEPVQNVPAKKEPVEDKKAGNPLVATPDKKGGLAKFGPGPKMLIPKPKIPKGELTPGYVPPHTGAAKAGVALAKKLKQWKPPTTAASGQKLKALSPKGSRASKTATADKKAIQKTVMAKYDKKAAAKQKKRLATQAKKQRSWAHTRAVIRKRAPAVVSAAHGDKKKAAAPAPAEDPKIAALKAKFEAMKKKLQAGKAPKKHATTAAKKEAGPSWVHASLPTKKKKSSKEKKKALKTPETLDDIMETQECEECNDMADQLMNPEAFIEPTVERKKYEKIKALEKKERLALRASKKENHKLAHKNHELERLLKQQAMGLSTVSATLALGPHLRRAPTHPAPTAPTKAAAPVAASTPTKKQDATKKQSSAVTAAAAEQELILKRRREALRAKLKKKFLAMKAKIDAKKKAAALKKAKLKALLKARGLA